MRILIISDLHGNLEGVRSLPADYDELWVLGDLVNYGPNPSEVIDFVRNHASLVIRGNHDDAAGYGRDPECSAPFRRLAEETGRFTMSAVSEEQRSFLRALPTTAERRIGATRFFLCHATPNDPLHEYLSDIFTISANLAGIPGISIPCGTTDFDGGSKLPVGLQILGPHLGEAKLLQIAKAAETL